MATMNADKSNQRKVFYTKPNGNRSSICIGNVTGPRRIGKKTCDKVLRIVNQLEEAFSFGMEPDRKVMEEIAKLSKKLISKLEKTGLLPRKVYVELAELHKQWLLSLRGNVKPSTINTYRAHSQHIVDFLGADRPLGSISTFDVDEFPDYLIEEKSLQGGTPSAVLTYSRTFFNFAVRKGYLASNPLMGIRANAFEFASPVMISEEHRERLLAAARNDEERLLVALWSYCGMRKREPSLLKWDECLDAGSAEVDGEKVPTHFLIHEYKITSNGSSRKRICPAFEKVFPHLLQLWRNRDKDSPWMFANAKWRFANNSGFSTLMKTLHSIAGLERPERLFCNLRCTASEECVAAFGSARENEWLGHSEAVRRRHYRPELSTDVATNEALQFLKPSLLKNGADMVQQQDAPRSNTDKRGMSSDANCSVIRADAGHSSTLQKATASPSTTCSNAKNPEENGISSASGAASGAATTKKALETAFSAEDAKELLLKLLTQQPELLKKLLS